MINEYKLPKVSIAVLILIAALCYTSFLWLGENPSYMYLNEVNHSPDPSHIFGTDNLGRDIFEMIWAGGAVSITIGISATLISSVIAVIYGTLSGISIRFIDGAMMRFTDILLSIPSILIIIFIQGILGESSILSLSIVIGLTSWMSISKVVRHEVRQIKNSDYILSSKLMGASIIHIIRMHMAPNFFPGIMFMIISNVGMSIATEATLSFMGLGLSQDVVSWGSMMALSERALLTNSWWVIVIPGFFLVTTVVCVTNIGEYIRSKNSIQYIT